MTSRVEVVISAHDVAFDAQVFAAADEFVGNCVSSVTALAARQRSFDGRPTHFWGILPQPVQHQDL
jgi:hypothetical protein